MKFETAVFEGAEGMKLPAYIWMPEGDIRAVLQLTHGMTEHMGRYGALAERLSGEGIAAAGFDLRGHGKNPGSKSCASFGEGGWDRALQDMHLFREFLNESFGEKPHAMLGFSLGSFLLRDYLSIYADRVDKAIIMGTGRQPAALLAMLIKLIRAQADKFGFDNSSALVKKLSFETYNGKFRPNRTAFDWLCSDEEELDEYIRDPLCRKEISSGLFMQMLESMKRTGSPDSYEKWNKNMPLLLLSGGDDPVGDMGKGVEKLALDMQRAGIRDLSLKLLPGARHDVLHEIKSGAADRAVSTIIEFLEK